MRIRYLLPILAAVLLSGPASAATLRFTASLDGGQEVPPAATSATGVAELIVDTITENLFVDLDVSGISTDDLADNLVAAPVGPVHLHVAPRGSNGPIAVPFAFNANYQDTADGFSLRTIVSYDVGAASGLAFGDFLAALNTEGVYFNVHTDAFGAGEIRGQVVADVAPVPLPASGLMLVGALAFGAWRARRPVQT